MLQLMQHKEPDKVKAANKWNTLLIAISQDRNRAAFKEIFEHFQLCGGILRFFCRRSQVVEFKK